MPKHQGKDGTFVMGANAVGNLRNWSFSDNPDVVDATVMGDTHKDQLVGLGSVTGSLQCFLDPADTLGQGAITAGAEVASAEIHPIGDASGNVYWDFVNLRFAKVDRQADVSGMVEFNVDFVAESYTEATTP